MFTERQSTLLAHAETLADTTLMADAFTTQATARIATIQLTANAIVSRSDTRSQRVEI